MSGELEKQDLLADLAQVDVLLAQSVENADVVSEMSFRDRRGAIQKRIDELDTATHELADVALIFDGQPVIGSRSIDADFAAKALEKFQEIVSKLFADRSEDGLKNARGGVPMRDISGFQITGLAHGSFGFLLEEKDARQASMVPTALRETLDEALETIAAFYSERDAEYTNMLEVVNPRVFSAVSDFFTHLYKNDSTIKIASKREISVLSEGLVAKAYERSMETSVEEETKELAGKLMGIGPTKQTFEFLPTGWPEAVTGKTGSRLSRDYLERIEKEGVTLGKEFRITLLTRKTQKPTGQEVISYTALNLEEIS